MCALRVCARCGERSLSVSCPGEGGAGSRVRGWWWGVSLRPPRQGLTVPFAAAGNQERGWNDPPQFSYGLQAQAGGPRRTPLTRRAPPPPAGAPPGQHPQSPRPADAQRSLRAGGAAGAALRVRVRVPPPARIGWESRPGLGGGSGPPCPAAVAGGGGAEPVAPARAAGRGGAEAGRCRHSLGGPGGGPGTPGPRSRWASVGAGSAAPGVPAAGAGLRGLRAAASSCRCRSSAGRGPRCLRRAPPSAGAAPPRAPRPGPAGREREAKRRGRPGGERGARRRRPRPAAGGPRRLPPRGAGEAPAPSSASAPGAGGAAARGARQGLPGGRGEPALPQGLPRAGGGRVSPPAPAHLRFQKQVCDDIGRRLTVLGDAWAQGKLSAPVRKRMSLLVQGEGRAGLHPGQCLALGQGAPVGRLTPLH